MLSCLGHATYIYVHITVVINVHAGNHVARLQFTWLNIDARTFHKGKIGQTIEIKELHVGTNKSEYVWLHNWTLETNSLNGHHGHVPTTYMYFVLVVSCYASTALVI